MGGVGGGRVVGGVLRGDHSRAAIRGDTGLQLFRRLSQTEVGRGTLLRNLLLGGVAGLAAVGASDPPIGALNWVTVPAARDRPVLIVLAGCLAILGWVCWQLLRQNGRLILALEAHPAEPGRGREALAVDDLVPLEPGMPAPEFTGRDLDGELVSLQSLLAAGRPVVLFFTDPACVACAPGLELVAHAQRERADELTLAVISRGVSSGRRHGQCNWVCSGSFPSMMRRCLRPTESSAFPASG